MICPCIGYAGPCQINTPWGVEMHYHGKRWRSETADGQRKTVAIPEWRRPTAAIVRHTDDQRWENYRRLALEELDAEFSA